MTTRFANCFPTRHSLPTLSSHTSSHLKQHSCYVYVKRMICTRSIPTNELQPFFHSPIVPLFISNLSVMRQVNLGEYSRPRCRTLSLRQFAPLHANDTLRAHKLRARSM